MACTQENSKKWLDETNNIASRAHDKEGVACNRLKLCLVERTNKTPGWCAVRLNVAERRFLSFLTKRLKSISTTDQELTQRACLPHSKFAPWS